MDSFDISFKLVRTIIILGILFMVGIWVFRIARITQSNGVIYNITIPSMSNTLPTEYFATEYVESNGCISFKDEFGFNHKHCGPYSVTKW